MQAIMEHMTSQEWASLVESYRMRALGRIASIGVGFILYAICFTRGWAVAKDWDKQHRNSNDDCARFGVSLAGAILGMILVGLLFANLPDVFGPEAGLAETFK